MWKTTKIYHQFGTFTKKNSRQKEIPHHFTADEFNDYFLSIAETLVKSQDSPDSDKQYSCSKRLVDFCQQKTKGTDSCTIPLMAVHEMGKYISGMNNKVYFVSPFLFVLSLIQKDETIGLPFVVFHGIQKVVKYLCKRLPPLLLKCESPRKNRTVG